MREPSVRDEWETPSGLFDKLNAVFHFTLDACANWENAKVEPHYFGYGKQGEVNTYRDGLLQIWTPMVCWLNPPYSDIAPWLEKAYEESQRGATVVALIPNDPSTKWWCDWAMKADELCWLTGKRVQFISPPGVKASSNTGTNVVLVFQPQWTPKMSMWDWTREPFTSRRVRT